MIKRIITLIIIFCLLFEQAGFSQVVGPLVLPSAITGFMAADKFRPIHLRSVSLEAGENNFRILLDKGDLKNPDPQDLKASTHSLLQYFFVGLSLPNESFWVNLRPDSLDNIIDDHLAKTDMGRIMLEADVQLKKDTAKYTSPNSAEGRQYWNKLYQKAEELFGSENISIPTLTRPWIVPNEIILRQTENNAYIYKATLKVMLEADYLKTSSKTAFADERLKILNEYSSQLIRELVLPKLTRDVNISQRYAGLRQVYYSLILAQWFKSKSHVTSHMSQVDSKDLSGLTSKTPWSKDDYYQSYRKSFQNGEYNIRENAQTPYGPTIRQYFSGGIKFEAAGLISAGHMTAVVGDPAIKIFPQNTLAVEVKIGPGNQYNIENTGMGASRPEDHPSVKVSSPGAPVSSARDGNEAKFDGGEGQAVGKTAGDALSNEGQEISDISIEEAAPRLAEVAIEMVKEIEKRGFDAVVMSGGSALVTYKLIGAAWKKVFPDKPLKINTLSLTENVYLYKEAHVSTAERVFTKLEEMAQSKPIMYVDTHWVLGEKRRRIEVRNSKLSKLDISYAVFAAPVPREKDIVGTHDEKILRFIENLAKNTSNAISSSRFISLCQLDDANIARFESLLNARERDHINLIVSAIEQKKDGGAQADGGIVERLKGIFRQRMPAEGQIPPAEEKKVSTPVAPEAQEDSSWGIPEVIEKSAWKGYGRGDIEYTMAVEFPLFDINGIVPLLRKGSVLDIGSGAGDLDLLLALEGHRTVGLDLSTKQVAKARQKRARVAQLETGVKIYDEKPLIKKGSEYFFKFQMLEPYRHFIDPGMEYLTSARPYSSQAIAAAVSRLIFLPGDFDIERQRLGEMFGTFDNIVIASTHRYLNPLSLLESANRLLVDNGRLVMQISDINAVDLDAVVFKRGEQRWYSDWFLAGFKEAREDPNRRYVPFFDLATAAGFELVRKTATSEDGAVYLVFEKRRDFSAGQIDELCKQGIPGDRYVEFFKQKNWLKIASLVQESLELLDPARAGKFKEYIGKKAGEMDAILAQPEPYEKWADAIEISFLWELQSYNREVLSKRIDEQGEGLRDGGELQPEDENAGEQFGFKKETLRDRAKFAWYERQFKQTRHSQFTVGDYDADAIKAVKKLAEIKSLRAAKSILDDFPAASGDLREAELEALRKMGAPALELMRSVIKEGNSYSKLYHIARGIASIDRAKAIEDLLPIAGDENEVYSWRDLTILVLAEFGKGDPRVIKTLVDLVISGLKKDEHDLVAYSASKGLAGLGEGAAEAVIAEALDRNNPEVVRKKMFWTLYAMSRNEADTESRPAPFLKKPFLEFLRHLDPLVRAQACYYVPLISEIKDDSLGFLMVLLDDPEAQVRAKAEEVLREAFASQAKHYGLNGSYSYTYPIPTEEYLISAKRLIGLAKALQSAGVDSPGISSVIGPLNKKPVAVEDAQRLSGKVDTWKQEGLGPLQIIATLKLSLANTFTREQFDLYEPALLELARQAGDIVTPLFEEGLTRIKGLIDNEQDLKVFGYDLIRMGKAAGAQINPVYGSLLMLMTSFHVRKLKRYWPELLESAIAAEGNAQYLFKCGFPLLEDSINSKEDVKKIGRDFRSAFALCQGVESQTSSALLALEGFIREFPNAWNKLIKPMMYGQTQAAFLCLMEIRSLYDSGALKSDADLEFLNELIQAQGIKAYDFMASFLSMGIYKGLIDKPISLEKEMLGRYIKESPYNIVEIYEAYKNNPEKLVELNARASSIHGKILSGDATEAENDPLFPHMLYYVFPPAVTTENSRYLNIYRYRPDRVTDTKAIPADLRDGYPTEVSTGSYILKDPAKPLDETPWNTILGAVAQVNQEPSAAMNGEDILGLGEQLIKDWESGGLGKNRGDLLKKLYQYFRDSRNSTLPSSLDSIDNIMALKEFVGDTLQNLVSECLEQYRKSYPEEYDRIIGEKLPGRITEPGKVALAIKAILDRFREDPEQAKEKISSLLDIQDETAIDQLWEKVKDKADRKDIKKVLEDLTLKRQAGKEATEIVAVLQGKEYKKMQGEVSAKYQFNESQGKMKLKFIVSKRKAHGVVGLNMGVCVAPDEELWNNPNFMNAIIFDENNIAQGGMHLLVIEDNGKKYLVLPGLNPSISLLTKVNSDDIYNKLIEYAHQLAKPLGCEEVLIPANSTIHSNRSEMQRAVSSRNYARITLSEEHPFSYAPFKYSFQECFIVGASRGVQKDGGALEQILQLEEAIKVLREAIARQTDETGNVDPFDLQKIVWWDMKMGALFAKDVLLWARLSESWVKEPMKARVRKWIESGELPLDLSLEEQAEFEKLILPPKEVLTKAFAGVFEINQALKEALKGAENAKVLDIASGTGQWSDLYPWEYTGIEIEEESVKKARRWSPGKEFLQMDSANLAFADKTFDYVLISDSLHHMDEAAAVKTIAEAKRVAKRGIVILDKVLPGNDPTRSFMTTRLDKGKFLRTTAELENMIGLKAVKEFNAGPWIEALWEIDLDGNSALKNGGVESPGGIDLRQLPIKTETRVSSSTASRTGVLTDPRLDAQWQEIQDLVNKGFQPATNRIQEYLQACRQSHRVPAQTDRVLTCIADIFRLEEDCCQDTDPALKDLLVLLDQ